MTLLRFVPDLTRGCPPLSLRRNRKGALCRLLEAVAHTQRGDLPHARAAATATATATHATAARTAAIAAW